MGLAATTLHRMLNFEQKLAIFNDPQFRSGHYYDHEFPAAGLALARIISHKAFVSMDAIRSRARSEIIDHPFVTHPVESYFWHQGEKLVVRFDPNSYIRIIDSWSNYDLLDRHRCGRATRKLSRRARGRTGMFSPSIPTSASIPTSRRS